MLSNDTKTIIIYMYIYKFVEFKAKIVSFSMCPDLTFRGSVLDAGHLMKNDKSLVSKTALLQRAHFIYISQLSKGLIKTYMVYTVCYCGFLYISGFVFGTLYIFNHILADNLHHYNQKWLQQNNIVNTHYKKRFNPLCQFSAFQ